jgi:hypothetical protein
MKNFRTVLMIACAGVLALAGAAMGDELLVTNAAAMGPGAAQADCAVALDANGMDATPADNETGPCGLEIVHTTSTGATVTDQSPDNEQVYRFSFLMNPNMIGGAGSASHIIYRSRGPNPQPGGGACNLNPTVDACGIRAKFLQSNYAVSLRCKDNFCGARGTPDIAISKTAPSKLCGEVVFATAGNGLIALAVVGENDVCPPSGDPAYRTVANSNSSIRSIDRTTIGLSGTHGAGQHVNPIYFDEFESFRTLAP